MEHYLYQNNAVNIYGEYFTDMDIIHHTEPEALKIANVFRYVVNHGTLQGEGGSQGWKLEKSF